MPLQPPMFLAVSEGVDLDLVVWFIAGAIWLFAQISAAKKKQGKRARQAPPPRAASPAAGSGGGEAPSPDELSEIFKRLGANIPATPPPAPRPAPMHAAPRMARRPAQPAARKSAAARVHPELARRLARAQQEAEEARQVVETERAAANAIVPGVQSRTGETRALDTATRHTGAILPRLYAMSMRLAALPTLPMPGFDRTHHTSRPLPTKLHTRREVRDSLIAQTYLQPPKSLSR